MTTWSTITHGARPNCKDKSAKSPLHYAARSGSLEVVEMLVNAGAELDAVDSADTAISIRTRTWEQRSIPLSDKDGEAARETQSVFRTER
jgi:ankyrin repeat protein